MKKLLLLLMLVLGINVFSSTEMQCVFMENRDPLISEILKRIEKDKKTDEIYCDGEKLKMLYYFYQDGEYNLNLGVNLKVDNVVVDENFKKLFHTKYKEYTTLLKKINKSKLKDSKVPTREIIRFFVTLENPNRIFVIGKYEKNNKTGAERFVGDSRNQEIFERHNFFEGLDATYEQLNSY